LTLPCWKVAQSRQAKAGATVSGKVLVVGGYGAVGKILGLRLVQLGYAVAAGGRRADPGRAIVEGLGLEWRQVDVASRDGWDAALAGIDVVIVCIDQRDTGFVEYVLARGLLYMDISADDAHFRRVETLAIPANAGAFLSLGFAPGLSNLMAARLIGSVEHASTLRLGLLFGINDQHGAAGVDWTLGAIFAGARDRPVAELDWGRPWGRRRMYGVGFADQFALARTHPGLSATTYIGFDSRIATAAAFAAASMFGDNSVVRRLVAAASHPIGLGSKVCGILAEVSDGKRTHRLRFIGSEETRTTAELAALMAHDIMRTDRRGGVFHSHQVIDAERLMGAGQAAGLGTFEHL
jgi:saccharopine dehydrogenase (NAD+, L-lysine-forming)